MSWAETEQAPGQVQGARAQPGPGIGELGPRQVRAQSPGGTWWSVAGLLALEAQERFKPRDRRLSAGPATSVSLGLGLGAQDLGGDLTGPRHGQRETPMWRKGGEAG